MRQQARGWGAATLGIVFALVWQVGTVRAGPVSPLVVEPTILSAPALPATLDVAGDAAPLAMPAANGWVSPAFETVSVNIVPVRMSGDASSTTVSTQHTLIPLPDAAWTGMAGLLTLASIKFVRNFRRLLA